MSVDVFRCFALAILGRDLETAFGSVGRVVSPQPSGQDFSVHVFYSTEKNGLPFWKVALNIL